MRLCVELYGVEIGTLTGTARTFDFAAHDRGIGAFGVNSPVLSVAIPLTPRPRRDHAARRRNWFSELLPEGDQYDYMLAQSQIIRGDTLAFLAHYGRDIAGAVQIWNLDDPAEPRTPELRPVTEAQVRSLLEDPITTPLANIAGQGKSSLGGVQPKVVLVKTPEGWAQAVGGYPTTHILKPQLGGDLASSIFDEEYGSRIARHLGLAEFDTKIVEFDGLAALVIERFDRRNGQRIHQEDFSQALGAARNEKYQEMGGVVSLKRVAATLTRYAPEPDLRRLARMVVLAVAIGNLDMHTKNIGLLHFEDGDVRLAPAYDVVPQAHMRNGGRLALAVNRKYVHSEITHGDLEHELAAWGLHRAGKLIDETLDEIEAVVSSEPPLPGAYPRLQHDILSFIGGLRGDVGA